LFSCLRRRAMSLSRPRWECTTRWAHVWRRRIRCFRAYPIEARLEAWRSLAGHVWCIAFRLGPATPGQRYSRVPSPPEALVRASGWDCLIWRAKTQRPLRTPWRRAPFRAGTVCFRSCRVRGGWDEKAQPAWERNRGRWEVTWVREGVCFSRSRSPCRQHPRRTTATAPGCLSASAALFRLRRLASVASR
jgi:hypothetical protein